MTSLQTLPDARSSLGEAFLLGNTKVMIYPASCRLQCAYDYDLRFTNKFHSAREGLGLFHQRHSIIEEGFTISRPELETALKLFARLQWEGRMDEWRVRITREASGAHTE